tara:strand:+ start:2564 stop:3418 length:855 start_codon:yes stop_codon:yes gene_type:complete
MIEEVLVIGGTHGNEMVGVFLADYLKKNPYKAESFTVRSLIANEEAARLKKRYIDFDLNRAVRAEEARGSHEERVVERLQKQIHKPEKTLIIDLHTTTANMGVTYILTRSDPLTKELIFRAQRGQAGEFVLETKELDDKTHFVNTMADHGFMIEVGPVPQNYLCTKSIEKTWYTLLRIFDLLDKKNQGLLPSLKGNFNYFKELSFLDFPRDAAGEIQALLHPNLIGRDYQLIKEDEPVFYQLPDEPIYEKAASGYYATFINEAAYYEKNMAMMLCERRVLSEEF